METLSNPAQMQSGFYWALNMKLQSKSIVYWNAKDKMFSLHGSHKRYKANRISPNTRYVGVLQLEQAFITEAEKTYTELPENPELHLVGGTDRDSE